MEDLIRELVAYADRTPGNATAIDLVIALCDDDLDPEVHADLDEIADRYGVTSWENVLDAMDADNDCWND